MVILYLLLDSPPTWLSLVLAQSITEQNNTINWYYIVNTVSENNSIKKVSNFRPMFHLCINLVVGFY